MLNMSFNNIVNCSNVCCTLLSTNKVADTIFTYFGIVCCYDIEQ